jgi:FkbM family methyltransferase
MKRSYSPVSQSAFNAQNRLQRLCSSSPFAVRSLAKAVNKIASPLTHTLTKDRLVDAHVYGRNLRMPVEHSLPAILRAFPQFNRPLALAVTAVAASSSNSPLTVVDVGANIGETVTVIEEKNPGLCSYLCVEADADIAEICRFNHNGNASVQTVQSFIGENEGAVVRLEDDGRANPSTKLVTGVDTASSASNNRLVRLDTVVAPFAETHGSLNLLKVDVEGYDFSVLRSGSEILRRYRPAVYFEWYPELLKGLHEDVLGGFDYLASLGYEHFVLFTRIGDYYCNFSRPDRSVLQSLALAALHNKELVYFDVFVSTSESTCNTLVQLCLSADR